MAVFERKTWGVFLIVSLFFLFTSRLGAAADPVHFTPVDSTASRYVATLWGAVSVGSQGLDLNDEIGVFDNTLCIGAAVITDSMITEGTYSVIISRDDPETPNEVEGASAGDALTFQLWRANENKYYDLEPVIAGDISWPGDNIFSQVDLKTVVTDSVLASFTYTPANGCAPLEVQFTDTSTGDPTSWAWDFGDGNTSQNQNTTHTFNQPGTFVVTLTVTNASGATNTSSHNVEVSQKAIADFTFNKSSGNKPLTVHFTDQSLNSPDSWAWDFGDGNTSTEQNPIHTYSQKGNYTITLTVTKGSCQDTKTVSDAITVLTSGLSPLAAFSADITLGCAPLVVKFLDESTGNPSFWHWDFGDGQSSDQQVPAEHEYSHSGLYTVSLTVKNAQGQEDTLRRTEWVRVQSKPLVDFRVDKTTVCPNTEVQFTDQSSGYPTGWRWNFGDGGISTQQNPTHTYQNPGLYMVRLIATNNCGMGMLQKAKFIEVKAPNIDFETDQDSNCSQLTIQFINKSTGGISDWQWGFGDGQTSDLQSPNHQYNNPGIYDVTLTGANECGPTSITKKVLVRGKLTVDFSFSANPGAINQDIQFTDNSTGGPTSWLWDFGDGTSSESQNPIHQYAQPGEYKITLKVQNDCYNSSSHRSIVIGSENAALFTTDVDSVCINKAVNFINGSAPDLNNWLWDFGDGSVSTEKNPSHIFTSTGTQQVKLTAFKQNDPNNAPYYYIKTLEVQDELVIEADTTSGCAPMSVQFWNNATQASEFYWDFGDGEHSVEPNPVHTYTTPGTYTVNLNIPNACGPTKTIDIEVKDTLKSDFSVSKSSGPIPLEVQFSDHSINASQFNWDFGDGEFSTEQNPSHIYQRGGSYLVRLIVSNGECEHEKSLRVEAYDPGSIHGMIINAKTSQPVSEANIKILGEDANQTSNNGEYSFSGLRPGSYALTVSANGFESAFIQQILVKPGRDTEQDIYLNQAIGYISGRITSSTDPNSPIAGATVVARSIDPAYSQQAITDADGKYVIFIGQEGIYELIASASGYWPKVDHNQEVGGYEINAGIGATSFENHHLTLAPRPWQPQVTISSLETENRLSSTEVERQTEIFIYVDQNLPQLAIDLDPNISNQVGSFDSPEFVDGTHPYYKVTYSGYMGQAIQQIGALIKIDNGNQTATLPYVFMVNPNTMPGQGQCLKGVSREIIPAEGGIINGLGWVDLDADGQMDIQDNSFIEIPGCCNREGINNFETSSWIACLSRLSDPSLASAFAVYQLDLLDEVGNRIELPVKEENPLILHLQFDSSTFKGSLGDLAIKYQDANGVWQSGLKNVHLDDNGLVLTATDFTRFALFSTKSAPSNLVVKHDSMSQLDLMWHDNSENEVGFEIWRCNSEDHQKDLNYTLLTVTDPNLTSYSDFNREVGETYYYRIRAVTKLGYTDYSADAGKLVDQCDFAPAAPQNLRVESVSKTEVVISWTDQSDCASGFDILRRTGESGDYETIGSVSSNETSYTDSTVSPGTTYYYIVKATNIKGVSPESEPVQVATDKKSSSGGGSSGMCFLSTLSCSCSNFWKWIIK